MGAHRRRGWHRGREPGPSGRSQGLPRLARQGWLSQELGHGRDTVTAEMPLEAWEVG